MLQSALTRALLGTALVSLSACAGSGRERPIKMGPVDTGAGSVTAARKFLEGRWALESFEVYAPGKPPLTLKGQGTLTYDEFSNLAMEIRTDQATSDLLRAAGIDVQGGTISVSGRTAVDVPNRTLTYMIQGQPAAGTGPLATSRKRYWQVEGGVLTLTTKDDAGNPTSVGRWKKIS
jgi:hypothetical protein